MKLIFLDIDGVLVTRRPGCFEEHLLRNLKRVCNESGAHIVLSSDWRRHPQARQEAQRVLGTVGLKFIACTPCMSPYLAQRPTEIMTWKREWRKGRSGEEPLTNWVAIDDRELVQERHGQHLRGHFVQTHPLRGLTEDSADECIRILNQELPPAASEFGSSFDNSMVMSNRGASVAARFSTGGSLPGLDSKRPSDGFGARAGDSRIDAATHSAAAASVLSAAAANRALQVHASSAPAAGARGRGMRGRSVGAALGGRR